MNTPTNDIIPQGYKMTELGALPEEWKVVKLANLIEEVKEKNKDNEKLKVYTVSNIFGFILSDLFFDKKVYSKQLTNYKIIRENYFAYNPYRINVGSIGLFQDYIGLVSPAYIVFKIKMIHELNPNYFFLLLKSSYYTSEIKRMAMSRGSIRRSLSFKDLSDFIIPLPPLPEQQKIAAVLSAVQEAKEKTEAVIDVAKALKKSMMKHLFTYGPVSPEETETVPLKETEIGPVPEDWEVVRLGDVAEIIMGQSPPGSSYNERGEGLPFLQGKAEFGSLHPKHIKYTTAPMKIAPKNSVLLSVRAPVGDVNISEIEYCIGRGLSSLSLPTGSNIFLFYMLNHLEKELEKEGTGSTFKAITKSKLINLLLPLPPLPIQQKIAFILSAIDAKIEAEENKKKALEELFKSLLHNLMTAKIRVNHLGVTS
jgi:type I restriction enzyme S subunit